MDGHLSHGTCVRRLGFFLQLFLAFHNLEAICCLNFEGLSLLQFRERIEIDPYGALSGWNFEDDDPCSWLGVGCSDGKVVVLNLEDLCLVGTLSPGLGALNHMRFIILHNNSFSGAIPGEIGQLKELEVLDLGSNNFSGPLPSELSNILSLKILLLDDNKFLGVMPTDLYELSMYSNSKFLMDNSVSDNSIGASYSDGRPTRCVNGEVECSVKQVSPQNRKTRRKLAIHSESVSPSPSPIKSSISWLLASASPPSIALPPSTSTKSFKIAFVPAPMKDSLSSPTPSPSLVSTTHSVSARSPSATPHTSEASKNDQKIHLMYILVPVGVSIFCAAFCIGVFLCWHSKVVTVRPWTTGLSGQLQKVFITGVPSLRRSELEAACEDFSNIIGTTTESTIYKGTLSSGVEIAVISSAAASIKAWSKQAESQFRKKIDMLSKVNHKNFVNLLGYCEEEEPFMRMMVFEYAPNGSLYEHLHNREAEHLDWGMRLRIAMGMSYCLEYMHQLNPPVVHTSLNSMTVHLTDDYAAKISDTSFRKTPSLKSAPGNMKPSADAASNVYSFGLILLEMMTGRVPDSEDEGQLIDWSSDYLRGASPVPNMMDPNLKSFKEEEAIALCNIILSCIDPDPSRRPRMKDVNSQMRQVTALRPDETAPRLSPLWWAELEILSSSDAS